MKGSLMRLSCSVSSFLVSLYLAQKCLSLALPGLGKECIMVLGIERYSDFTDRHIPPNICSCLSSMSWLWVKKNIL